MPPPLNAVERGGRARAGEGEIRYPKACGRPARVRNTSTRIDEVTILVGQAGARVEATLAGAIELEARFATRQKRRVRGCASR